MYFRSIPNLEYGTKPISYPFSESDYVVAKNFFRRYRVNEDVFSYAVYFKRYSVLEGETIYQVAEKAYEDPLLDWVVVLTNGMVNPLFDWPMSGSELRKHCEANYDNPYGTIHHYEVVEAYAENGVPILQEGLKVDETFYNSIYKYWDGTQTRSIPGSNISRPVTVFEHEETENEKKREIYILKPNYLTAFMDDFRKSNLYQKSSDFISTGLKRTGQ